MSLAGENLRLCEVYQLLPERIPAPSASARRLTTRVSQCSNTSTSQKTGDKRHGKLIPLLGESSRDRDIYEQTRIDADLRPLGRASMVRDLPRADGVRPRGGSCVLGERPRRAIVDRRCALRGRPPCREAERSHHCDDADVSLCVANSFRRCRVWASPGNGCSGVGPYARLWPPVYTLGDLDLLSVARGGPSRCVGEPTDK
jgi:hypothetical protein